MQLSNQVYALSNASQFGVSYSTYAGKKDKTPAIYTLEVDKNKIQIFYHSTAQVKTEDKVENIHNKEYVGSIKAVPGSLYIELTEALLPSKLTNDQYKFHWEILVNNAIPYWIENSMNLVENNRIAPVWLLISELIKLTCYDDVADTFTLYDISTVKAFTENDWYEVLEKCVKSCPNVPQFRNALKGRLAESKQPDNSTDDVVNTDKA
jgi:hypothetical protein